MVITHSDPWLTATPQSTRSDVQQAVPWGALTFVKFSLHIKTQRFLIKNQQTEEFSEQLRIVFLICLKKTYIL
jgi:hypothetical protein